MKKNMFIVFLALVLAACAPAQTNITDIQNTAVSIAQTGVALTQTALPTFTLPPPTTLPTSTTAPILPTLIPTEPPPPVLTPDTIQVKRWKEYQTELIKATLSGYDPALYDMALCEWDILGRSGQEVYVWAYCAAFGGENGRLPSVIHLEANGSIQNVEVPEINNSTWDTQIRKMFPQEVREKFGLYEGNSLFFGRIKEMINHIHYRESHPEEPPLVVLSAMPKVTPTP